MIRSYSGEYEGECSGSVESHLKAQSEHIMCPHDFKVVLLLILNDSMQIWQLSYRSNRSVHFLYFSSISFFSISISRILKKDRVI